MVQVTPAFRYENAPSGELTVVMANSTTNLGMRQAIELSMVGHSLADTAWETKDWLPEDEDQRINALRSIGSRAISAFYGLQKSPGGMVSVALQTLGEAEEKAFERRVDMGTDDDEHLPWWVNSFDNEQYMLRGYGAATLQTPGSRLQQWINRRWHPERQIEVIQMVNVDPDHQRQAIGAALLHGLLHQMPDDRWVVAHVPEADAELVTKLMSIGFLPTDTVEHVNLTQNVGYNAVHMNAAHASEVRERLESAHKWLAEGEAIHVYESIR